MGMVVYPCCMSTGPIDFIREPNRDDKPDTEYGGRSGLIQPGVVAGLEGHAVTSSEARGMMVRSVPASELTEQQIPGKDGVPIVRVIAVVDPAGNPIDPHTGLVIDLAALGVEEPKPGTAVVEVPPPTENP